MLSGAANVHGPRRAILYTRVSGDRQRDHGYSLSDQKRELEEWAAKEGYQVLEAVEDGAWSGGSLVRPGLDRVRALVAGGGVDAVATLFRDRLARGVYAGLLAEEFAEHGCKLIPLNAQMDDSPEGELHGGMLDIIANWERKKIAERTRRGKLQKARQGKIVATHRPPFGFSYTAQRDNYVAKADEMRVVERIFGMVRRRRHQRGEEGFRPRGRSHAGGRQVLVRGHGTEDPQERCVQGPQLLGDKSARLSRRGRDTGRSHTLRRLLVWAPESHPETSSGKRYLPHEDQDHCPSPRGAGRRAHA
jgi:DNA invertase Pin-like site-specific DNA recombinase